MENTSEKKKVFDKSQEGKQKDEREDRKYDPKIANEFWEGIWEQHQTTYKWW